MTRPSTYQDAVGQLQSVHNANEITNDSSPDRPNPVAQPSAPDEFSQGSPQGSSFGIGKNGEELGT